MKARKNSKRKASTSQNESLRSSSVGEDPLQSQDETIQEEPLAKKANSSKGESSVQVKMEPRGGVEELDTNEYYQLDPDSVRTETELWCSCPAVEKGEVGCGEGCYNRSRRVECGSGCGSGEQCSNRALSTAGTPPLMFSDGVLLVSTNLQPGDLVGQYTGQVMTRETFQTRLSEEYVREQDLSLHVYPLTEDLVVDATSKGSICRFAEHACSPNAEISSWTVEGLECLAITACREIPAGDKLTLDLSPPMNFLCTSKRCSCDSTNCKKLIGKTAITRGPEKCGACLVKVLDSGEVGEVLLHPGLATPVCQGCCDLHHQQDWLNQPGQLCTWCCKPGKLLNCVSCPRAFCRKCLQQNLGTNYIKLAETGSWTCLLCDTNPLRAIRDVLWLSGEEERPRKPVTSRIFPPRTSAPAGRSPRPAQVRMSGRGMSPVVRTPRGGPSPAVGRSLGPRAPPGTPGVRGIRPVRGGVRPGTPRPRTPAPGGGRGGPVPVRMFGQSNVSIARVPRPQQRPETASIISQLQRYSGLSIQPVSESASSVETACNQVEAVHRSLQLTTSQSRKLVKSNVSEAKKELLETIKSCRAKLAEIESSL